MDGVPLLLEIIPEVEAAGGVPEPFPADNKKDLHVITIRRTGFFYLSNTLAYWLSKLMRSQSLTG
jgi:hypothetical protein